MVINFRRLLVVVSNGILGDSNGINGVVFCPVSRWQSHGLVGVLFIVIGWAQGGIVCICWYMLGYFYIC